MRCDRLAHNRQADAGAGILFLAVKSLKDLKDAVVIDHVEACAIVGDPQDAGRGRFTPADGRARGWCIAR